MELLAIRNISKSFGGVQAVKNCSFAIQPQKITALIGPNGAGKTTLFNLVNGFQAPDHGHIIFENQDVTNTAAWERSRLGMSRTFQLSRVFKNLSILDNLLLSVRQDDDLFWRMFLKPEPDSAFLERIKEVLEFVGLDKPLHTIVTDLSYGEQKLFDLARAILNPHTILLLDEPVAGVNPVIREKLKELLKKLKGENLPRAKSRGETILLIEHDMDFVRSVADHVIVMDQGSVLTEGNPEVVLKEKKVLEAYLGKE